MIHSTPKTRRRVLLAIVMAAAVTLSACGSSSDDDSSGNNDNASGDASAVQEQGRGPHTPITVPSPETPELGGKLIYGLEAETDGWDPTKNRWAPSGTLVAGAIFDPLAAFDADGVAQPYLAESFEPSADFMTWTIKLRPGIEFTNGTPLNSEAVATLLNAHRDSGLTGPAMRPVDETVVIDDLTVEVRMNTPWVVFPTVLVGQGGLVPEPSTIGTDEGNSDPIGTGPFVMEEWIPDTRTVVTRNPDYWQEGFPYLDEIEFRPITDFTSRDQALRAGDIDIMATTNEETIDDYRKDAAEGKFQIVEDQGENEELFIQLNNDKAPTDDQRVRQALAHATNRQLVADITVEGFYTIANGPWAPDSPWYSEVDYPEFDVAAGQALIDDYVAETGEPVSITLQAAGVSNLETLALIQEMWQQIGVEVQIDAIDQPTLILNGLTGDFDALLWRQYSGPDPDMEWHWWHASNASAIGDIALNFARNTDPRMAAALDEGRSAPDLETRREAYAKVQEQFATEVPVIFLYHAIIAVIADNQVHGITNGPLPDGQESLPMGGWFAGNTRFNQMWVEG